MLLGGRQNECEKNEAPHCGPKPRIVREHCQLMFGSTLKPILTLRMFYTQVRREMWGWYNPPIQKMLIFIREILALSREYEVAG